MSVITLFALVLATVARGENPLFGRILEKVVCEADAAHSYVLYVPGNYSKEQRWPVIFCFDPSARGQIPVERFRAAAEKYGYILAGSLTSRNGPYAANAVAAQAMVKDVSTHFSIDPQRVYAAGMSGGARVATSIALSGVAKGVIACGAGFPVLADGIPLRVPFVFFGIVGTEDFNFAEFRHLEEELAERNAVHHIATFDGGHVWSPELVLTEAVEWLELQAMRDGKKAKDDAFIQKMLNARHAALADLSGLEKWRGLKSLAADFEGLAETAEFTGRAVKLGISREVKEAVKAEKRRLLRESELVSELSKAAEGGASSKQRLAEKLRQQADAAGDPAERLMVRRAIAGYCSIAQETARELLEQKDYRRAAGLLEFFVALRPDQPRAWFNLSRAYGLSGDNKAAFESLERAAVAGFDDDARAEREPAFAKLRAETRFREILEKIRANRTDPAMELPAMKISSVLASVELRLFYQSKSGADFPLLSFLKVVSVRPGSAAAAAGVAPEMEITSIQGFRINGLTEGALYDAMAQPVKGEIVFTVRDSFRAGESTLRIALQKTRPADVSISGEKSAGAER